MQLGTQLTGQLSSSTDVDWFKYTLNGSAVLDLAFDLPTNSSFTDYFSLQIIDSAGTVLSGVERGQDGALKASLSDAGTYYIKVASTNYYYDSGLYGLTLTEDAYSTNYEQEHNGYGGVGTRLSANQKMSGQLFDSSDVDFYYIEATQAGSLTVNFDAPTNSSFTDYFKVTLQDPEFNTLSSFETGQDGELTAAVESAGYYWVRVESTDYYHDDRVYGITAALSSQVGSVETESNDTLASADEMQLGTQLTGQLSSSTDVDFFRISFDQSGIFSLALDTPTSSTFTDYFKIGIYNETGTEIANFSTGKDSEWEVGVDAGNYYIGVSPYSAYAFSSGNYGLTAQAAVVGDFEDEPNEKIANWITPGIQKYGQLSSYSDIDYFYFSVDENSSVTLDFDTPTNSPVLKHFGVMLFDSEGEIYAIRDGGSDFALNTYVKAGGVFVGVYSPAQTTHNSEIYGIFVNASTTEVDIESEPNDSTGLANRFDAEISGQISSISDIDHFIFEADTAGTLTVDFESPTFNQWTDYFQISVLDSTGRLLATKSTGQTTSLLLDIDSSGSYYVRVKAGNTEYDSGQYTLRKSLVTTDTFPDDSIFGTISDDFLVGTTDSEHFVGLGGNDVISGLAGIDTAQFQADSRYLGISYVDGIYAVRGLTGSGVHENTVTKLVDIERIATRDSSIELRESQKIAPIFGTTGADLLQGTTGNDRFDGRGGQDVVAGGDGIDSILIFGSIDDFEVLSSSGVTSIRSKGITGEYSGFEMISVAVEKLQFVNGKSRDLDTTEERVILGTRGNDNLRGTQNSDVFFAWEGQDEVDGGDGADTLVILGNTSDFELDFSLNDSSRISVQGKSGTRFENVNVQMTNIERLQFLDQEVLLDERPSLNILQSNYQISEGSDGGSFYVSLGSPPISDVVLNLVVDDQIRTDKDQISFTADNWDVRQEINVTAVDDTSLENNQVASLIIEIQSSDPSYRGLGDSALKFYVIDNDENGFAVATGKIWNDINGNGKIDQGEPAIQGVSVYSDANRNGSFDVGEISTLTDAQGGYRLGGLGLGSHVIKTVEPQGWQLTYPDEQLTGVTKLENLANTRQSYQTYYYETQSIDINPAYQGDYKNLGENIGLDQLRSQPQFSHVTGKGETIVIIDSGFQLDHPHFGRDSDGNGIGDRIIYSYDFSVGNDSDASGPISNQVHGTHVAGAAASSDFLFPGVAPEASLILLKVFPDSDPWAAGTDIVEALNWVARNADRYDITAVNLSLGDSDLHNLYVTNSYMSQSLAALVNAGVIPVFAAGNAYKGSTGIATGAADKNSISVGGVWGDWYLRHTALTAATDSITFFSQRSPEISDTFATGYVGAAAVGSTANHGYLRGTSMAAPIVTGIITLAQQISQENLGRKLSFSEIRSLIKDSNKLIYDGDDEVGQSSSYAYYGRIDALALAEAIVALKPAGSYVLDVSGTELFEGNNFGLTSTQSANGTEGDDVLAGSLLADTILAYGGDDLVYGADGDDRLLGDQGDDEMWGGSGSDTIRGGAGDDFLKGEDGNDILIGDAGADYLDGGAGIDVAVYSTYRSTLSRIDLQWQIENDTVVNVERISFDDGAVGLDTISEKAYRIYKAAFDRTPDEDGLGYWIQELDKGFALHQVTNSFVISQEFQNLYGADLNNEGFITALYNNVLDRDPDQGGLDYWINDMENNGMSRADVLASFSESAENIANTDPLIELGVVYQPYGDALVG